jgi:hypothetical protein
MSCTGPNEVMSSSHFHHKAGDERRRFCAVLIRMATTAAFKVIPQITSFTPTSGPVGTVVTITGVSLTQTKTVTFGGVKATTFTVNNDSKVTATVPTGAKTGKIGITTSGGSASSPTSFTVM